MDGPEAASQTSLAANLVDGGLRLLISNQSSHPVHAGLSVERLPKRDGIQITS